MPTKQPPTRSGRLSEIARHLVLPEGISSTGWPAVEKRSAELGIRYDDWQTGLGRAMLAKRDSGMYAASVGGVVVSIPRQVGKTYLLGGTVFSLCLLIPGLTVIWTAHRLRTANETFQAMQGLVARPKVDPHIKDVRLGSGDQLIQFHNGSRILFGARERGFGRGFSDVGLLVFDEAQILTENAIDDMVPATNQATNPLVVFIGTPPKPTDPGEVFTRKRLEAVEGRSTDMLYVELSADKDAKPDDRKQWAKANPSYPKRTPLESMQRMQSNLSEEAFLREGLGVWDDPPPEDPDSWEVIPELAWAACLHSDAGPDWMSPTRWALDLSPDGRSAAIAASDGAGVEVVDYRHGSDWVLARLLDLRSRHSFGTEANPLYLDSTGPATALLQSFDDAGIVYHRVTFDEHAQACAQLLTAVEDSTLGHIGQEPLDDAARVAKRRSVVDRWLWTRSKSEGDICPLVAAGLARWAAHAEVEVDAPPTPAFTDLSDYLDEE